MFHGVIRLELWLDATILRHFVSTATKSQLPVHGYSVHEHLLYRNIKKMTTKCWSILRTTTAVGSVWLFQVLVPSDSVVVVYCKSEVYTSVVVG